MPHRLSLPIVPAAPHQRYALALAALLAHGLLLSALVPLMRAHTPRSVPWPSPADTLLLLRIPAPALPAVAKHARATDHTTGRPEHLVRRATAQTKPSQPALGDNPDDARKPALAAPPRADAQAAPATAPTTPPRPAPLQLMLPRQEPASAPPSSWARGDDRSGLRRSRSDQFADTLGTDQTERRDTLSSDGATRIRRGNGCVLVKASRDSQLDPFNQSVRSSPLQSGPC